MFDSIFFETVKPFEGIDLGFSHEKLLGIEFQTKDTDCALDKFYVREDLQLEHRYSLGYWDETKPDKWTSATWVKTGDAVENKDYNGSMQFYTHVDVTDDECYWVQFTGEFDNGKLVEVELFEKHSSDSFNSRQEDLRKFFEKADNRPTEQGGYMKFVDGKLVDQWVNP